MNCVSGFGTQLTFKLLLLKRGTTKNAKLLHDGCHDVM